MQSTQPLRKGVFDIVDVKNEVLAGLTTSFAVVPELVAFAFVAGVDPLVGLYATFTFGLLTALLWAVRE